MQRTPDSTAFAVICFESPDIDQAIAEVAEVAGETPEFGVLVRERCR